MLSSVGEHSENDPVVSRHELLTQAQYAKTAEKAGCIILADLGNIAVLKKSVRSKLLRFSWISGIAPHLCTYGLFCKFACIAYDKKIQMYKSASVALRRVIER